MSVSWGLLPSVPCHFWGPLFWLGRPFGEGGDTFRETAGLFFCTQLDVPGRADDVVDRGRPEGAGHRQSDAIDPKRTPRLEAPCVHFSRLQFGIMHVQTMGHRAALSMSRRSQMGDAAPFRRPSLQQGSPCGCQPLRQTASLVLCNETRKMTGNS